MYTDILKRNILFNGLCDESYLYAMQFFSAEIKQHLKGEFLNRIGFTLPKFGLVLSGTVQVYVVDIEGHEMIMANVSSGATFGESLCYLQKESSVYIRAISDCTILWLDPSRIRNSENRLPFDIELASRFISMIASRALVMNERIQILSKLTLRKKLITFFSQYISQYGNNFTVPFNRNDMALYLGSERSALSRELSKMRDEGIINFYRNHFYILKKLSD